MIAKAKAISHGINAIRYMSGESEHKKHPEKIYHVCNQNLDADEAKVRFYGISAYILDNYKDGIYICTKA